MSKKIHFSLCITTLNGFNDLTFTGAAARNVLQALYGSEFCITPNITGDELLYQLIDRQTVTVMTDFAVIGANFPETINFNPYILAKHGGLYIHESVIDRLDENRCRWQRTDDLFNSEYGFSAPAPLLDVVNELVKFRINHENLNSPYVGVIRWG